MRIDRWIRNIIKKIPQSLIEKNLRKCKIKLNGKKVKSSYKIKEVLTGMSLYLGMEIPNWPPDNIVELSKKLEETV